MAEVIKPGTSVTFPVEHTNPLASVQTIRTPTEQDIVSNPVYSEILNTKVGEALAAYPPGQRTSQVEAAVRANVINAIIANIGSIYRFQLQDINVAAGQTLKFQSSWNEVYAGDVKIAPGGVIRVTISNPALPAFFLLNCKSLGST